MAESNAIPKTRTCTKCGITKPETLEHFALEKREYVLFKARCRDCWKEYLKQYRERNPDKDRDYYKKNKARINAINSANYRKRVKADPEYNRRNYEARRTAALERQKIYKRRRLVENGDEVRRKANEYRAKTQEQNRANQTNYRARTRGAEGNITPEDIRTKMASQSGACWWCSEPFPKGIYQIDHVIPLSRGGQNWPSNIVLCCMACNLKKHAKMPWEMDNPKAL